MRRPPDSQMPPDLPDYALSGFLRLQLQRPTAAGMDDVPAWPPHVPPAPARRMVAEPINDAVPDRVEPVQQDTFSEPDPYGFNGEVPAQKIRQRQILGSFKGLGVLTQAVVKSPRPRRL